MNNLRFLRLQRGLSQKALADLLKIHPVILCRLENGWLSKPPRGVEEKLKAVFGRNWNFLRLMQPVPEFADPQQTNSPDQ